MAGVFLYQFRVGPADRTGTKLAGRNRFPSISSPLRGILFPVFVPVCQFLAVRVWIRISSKSATESFGLPDHLARVYVALPYRRAIFSGQAGKSTAGSMKALIADCRDVAQALSLASGPGFEQPACPSGSAEASRLPNAKKCKMSERDTCERMFSLDCLFPCSQLELSKLFLSQIDDCPKE